MVLKFERDNTLDKLFEDLVGKPLKEKKQQDDPEALKKAMAAADRAEKKRKEKEKNSED